MNETGSAKSTATFACIGSLLCASVGPVFIKYLTGYLDLWTQNLLRYTAACLFWMPFLLWSIHSGRLDKRVWKRALLPAGTNIFLQTFWAGAFYYIDAAFMNLIVKSSIIWIAAFSLIFFADERGLIRSRRFWSGMLLSVVGVVGVLVAREDFGSKRTLTGILITLVAALLWGLYTVTARIAFRHIDSRIGFGAISIYTVAGLAILVLLFGHPAESLAMPPWPWASVVISGIFSIALSHVLYYAAMRRIGVTIPSLVLLSTPFAVLAISHAVFGESLHGLQWFFGMILMAGGGLAIWSQEHLKHVPPRENDA